MLAKGAVGKFEFENLNFEYERANDNVGNQIVFT